MKWLIIGAVVLGGVLLVSNLSQGGTLSSFNPAFGLALSSDQMIKADPNTMFGMAFYGGFHDMQQAPRGAWKYNMLEGQ